MMAEAAASFLARGPSPPSPPPPFAPGTVAIVPTTPAGSQPYAYRRLMPLAAWHVCEDAGSRQVASGGGEKRRREAVVRGGGWTPHPPLPVPQAHDGRASSAAWRRSAASRARAQARPSARSCWRHAAAAKRRHGAPRPLAQRMPLRAARSPGALRPLRPLPPAFPTLRRAAPPLDVSQPPPTFPKPPPCRRCDTRPLMLWQRTKRARPLPSPAPAPSPSAAAATSVYSSRAARLLPPPPTHPRTIALIVRAWSLCLPSFDPRSPSRARALLFFPSPAPRHRAARQQEEDFGRLRFRALGAKRFSVCVTPTDNDRRRGVQRCQPLASDVAGAAKSTRVRARGPIGGESEAESSSRWGLAQAATAVAAAAAGNGDLRPQKKQRSLAPAFSPHTTQTNTKPNPNPGSPPTRRFLYYCHPIPATRSPHFGARSKDT